MTVDQLRAVARALGDDLSRYENDLAAEHQYRTSLRHRAVLIILDDIWNKSDLDPFLVDSPRSRFLFTTRDTRIARFVGAREYRVDLLNEGQSSQLLALWAGYDTKDLPSAAQDIIRECGRLPLALATMGALLRDAGAAEWQDWLDRLKRADLSAIESVLPEGQQSFFRAVALSVEILNTDMRSRYKALAVLPEDMEATLPMLQTMWGLDPPTVRLVAKYLAERSLADWSPTTSSLRLHDLQLDYLRAQEPDHTAVDLISAAIRLSSHVIATDQGQFAAQVIGRLLPHCNNRYIDRWVNAASSSAPTPWLRPLRPALHPPGSGLLRTLQGHTDAVHRVAMTPDGRRAVSVSRDETLKVWDLECGRELCSLADLQMYVSDLAVTADGRRAIVTAQDSLIVLDLETGHKVRTLKGDSGHITAMAVTPDGRRAVSVSRTGPRGPHRGYRSSKEEDHWLFTLTLWDLEGGRELRTLVDRADEVGDVAVTPDGRRALVASANSVKVWELEKGNELRRLGSQAYSDSRGHLIANVEVTSDGQRAVSISHRILKLWDVEDGYELRALELHPHYAYHLAVTADGRRAIVTDGNSLTVWDLEAGHKVRTLKGHSENINGIAMTPDGRRAVSASQDKTLKVWNLEARGEVPSVPRHSEHVTEVVVTPEGRRVLSASEDGKLIVWDLENGNEPRTIEAAVYTLIVQGVGEPSVEEGCSHQVTCVAMTADGRRAVSGAGNNTVEVWDLESGQGFWLGDHFLSVDRVAVTLDGRRAVSVCQYDDVKVWDLERGRELHTLECHGPSALALTPDSRRVVFGCTHDLMVWDLNRGRHLHSLKGHGGSVYGLTVAADGRRAISASEDKTLKVWDLESGRELRTLRGHTDSVTGVAVTAMGRVISASLDKTLKVWDLESGRELRTLPGQSGHYIKGLPVTADGRHVIFASDDNTLKVWDLDTGATIASFTCESAVSCMAVGGRTVAAGDQNGRVYLLSLICGKKQGC